METFHSWLEPIKGFFNLALFTLGNGKFTLGALLYLAALIFLLFYVSGKTRIWMERRLLATRKLNPGTRHALASIVHYMVILVGLLIILQTAGINLTTLHVLAGAVGIGVGFGLQNIVSNFISGLIILLERPIKIGDRIEVASVEGDVVDIRARSTTVLTNDDIAIIVPNSKFITENVVNWSYNDEKVRFRIPVSVAYGSDVRLVERLLLEVAAENPDVLKIIEPVVRFTSFGDSGLNFELRAWSATLVHRKGKLLSALNFAIYDKFREHEIEIPFPHRDIHIRGGALELKSAAGETTIAPKAD